MFGCLIKTLYKLLAKQVGHTKQKLFTNLNLCFERLSGKKKMKRASSFNARPFCFASEWPSHITTYTSLFVLHLSYEKSMETMAHYNHLTGAVTSPINHPLKSHMLDSHCSWWLFHKRLVHAISSPIWTRRTVQIKPSQGWTPIWSTSFLPYFSWVIE